MKSPTAIFQRVSAGAADTAPFTVFLPDEQANGVSGTSFDQNQPVLFLIQHDPALKIISGSQSMGQLRRVRAITYAQTETGIVFTADDPTHDLSYIPDGPVDGIWYLDGGYKQIEAPGGPTYTVVSRTISVDIDTFGRPVPFSADYSATFEQYEWIPANTSLVDNNDIYPVVFTFLYGDV